MKSVNCSDWYRGWGLGNTHLGKLSKLEDGNFEWKGIRQGRHNNVIQKTFTIKFKLLKDGSFEFDITNKTNWLPDTRDVKEAIRILNFPKPDLIVKLKRIPNKNQLQMTFN